MLCVVLGTLDIEDQAVLPQQLFIRSFVEEPLVEAAVRNMSMMVVEEVDETPAFLMNGEMVNIDVNEEESVQDWLLYE